MSLHSPAAQPGWKALAGELEEQFADASLSGVRATHAVFVIAADAEDRIIINRRAGELTISFSGDTNQAGQFARSVPDFVLKGRFAGHR